MDHSFDNHPDLLLPYQDDLKSPGQQLTVFTPAPFNLGPDSVTQLIRFDTESPGEEAESSCKSISQTSLPADGQEESEGASCEARNLTICPIEQAQVELLEEENHEWGIGLPE